MNKSILARSFYIVSSIRERFLLRRVVWGFLFAYLSTTQLLAAPIQWRSKAFSYTAKEKPIQEFLSDFCVSEGLVCVISEKLKGHVSGRFNIAPQKVLEQIGASYGLIWFFDGNVLHIDSSQDARVAIMSMQFAEGDSVAKTLETLGLLDHKFSIRVSPEKILRASGPPRLVQMIEETVKSLEAKAKLASEKVSPSIAQQSAIPQVAVKVFPLRFAWAQDIALAHGGKEIVVPGIASTLRRLLSPKTAQSGYGPLKPITNDGSGVMATERSVASAVSTNHERVSPNRSVAAPAAAIQWPEIAAAGSRAEDLLPQVEADVRTNAVLIRDYSERLSSYGELVSSLDVQPELIQIDASIVDVHSDTIKNIGVDWSKFNQNIVFGKGGLIEPGLRNATSSLVDRSAGVSGGLSILGNSGRFFLAHIDVLESNGMAKVQARPSVVTTNNSEAILESTMSAYVRVSGERAAELFTISTGVSLRVTPLVINDGETRRIKLVIRIEDGSLQSQQVDQIPVVQRSTISTQALLSEGEGVLVGGYGYERSVDNASQVPVLGNVPIIGHLFRHTARETSKIERLFLITPRIISK